VRGELTALGREMERALASGKVDPPTGLHLEESRRQIALALDPRFQPPPPKPRPAPSFPLRFEPEDSVSR
jgi:hypothetical protein